MIIKRSWGGGSVNPWIMIGGLQRSVVRCGAWCINIDIGRIVLGGNTIEEIFS